MSGHLIPADAYRLGTGDLVVPDPDTDDFVQVSPDHPLYDLYVDVAVPMPDNLLWQPADFSDEGDDE